jgi:hypothetical protein
MSLQRRTRTESLALGFRQELDNTCAAIGSDKADTSPLCDFLTSRLAIGRKCPQFLSAYLRRGGYDYDASHNKNWLNQIIFYSQVKEIYVLNDGVVAHINDPNYVWQNPVTVNNTHDEVSMIMTIGKSKFIWDRETSKFIRKATLVDAKPSSSAAALLDAVEAPVIPTNPVELKEGEWFVAGPKGKNKKKGTG